MHILPSAAGRTNFTEFPLSLTFYFVLIPEGTLALTAPIPAHLLTNLAKQVIERKEWDKLRVLFLGGGGPSRHALGEGGLAPDIDASSVPLGEVIHHFSSKQISLISTLLELRASANAIDGSAFIPLNEAIEKEDETLVEKLVQKGADCCVASSDGQPMIHKALKKGLKKGIYRSFYHTSATKFPLELCETTKLSSIAVIIFHFHQESQHLGKMCGKIVMAPFSLNVL